MKENSRTDLQQPEIDTEYVEYLFSGKKPKRPIPKKVWVISGVTILTMLAVALVCLLLNPLANLFSGPWQTLCEETYAELAARNALHYILRITSQTEGKDPTVVEEQEIWLEGNNRLSHYLKQRQSFSRPPDNQHLRLDGEIYSRDVATVPWVWKRSVSGDSKEETKAWADYPYTFAQVQIGFSGVQVTYTKELEPSAGDDRIWIVFHFDLFGNLTHISRSYETSYIFSEKRKTETTVYTICDTAPEEIQGIFNRCREEVADIE